MGGRLFLLKDVKTYDASSIQQSVSDWSSGLFIKLRT